MCFSSSEVQVNAYIEDKQIAIEESSPIFVKYKTPSFKAEAAVSHFALKKFRNLVPLSLFPLPLLSK